MGVVAEESRITPGTHKGYGTLENCGPAAELG